MPILRISLNGNEKHWISGVVLWYFLFIVITAMVSPNMVFDKTVLKLPAGCMFFPP